MTVDHCEFTNMHTCTQVNSNGVLSFGYSFISSYPEFSGATNNYALIAPFWADINTNIRGTIYYRFANITSSIVTTLDSYIMDSSFSPSLVFIATWDGVAEYGTIGQDVSIIIMSLCYYK